MAVVRRRVAVHDEERRAVLDGGARQARRRVDLERRSDHEERVGLRRVGEGLSGLSFRHRLTERDRRRLQEPAALAARIVLARGEACLHRSAILARAAREASDLERGAVDLDHHGR